ncbi:MAG: SUMF1/EgtB/PvdO family nonheme iron enzyme [Amaricoccus sp.]|uniref:formylglycine-generating enzyme family protein n=1 Tax=Amaricoccus sp. TaxID=1872485 RepID=UPI0033148F56
MRAALALALAALASPALAEEPVPGVVTAAISWPVEFYDPGAGTAPADLVLPMPCGGAMAFQRVGVPVDTADPLSDRRLRLGQSQEQTGYSDYLRPDYLRGSFSAADESFYYIARYELTEGQYRALNGDCAPPERKDRIAKGGLSWFEAVDLSRRYSEWLFADARDALPRDGDAVAFPRLPTETEWEYAARGGTRIAPTDFPGRRFQGDAPLRDFALFQAPGSARGKLGPVGIRKPNPLGLYDIYGNAEELILEPFRLNAVGRPHGQTGGVVTRGGSVLSTDDQIYSAARTEYPPFRSSDGHAQAVDTFGLRLVLGTQVASSDARLTEIRRRWIALANSVASGGADPMAELTALIDEETDPRRRQALTEAQLEFRRARDEARTALREAAKSTLLSGAVFVETLTTNAAAIDQMRTNLSVATDLLQVSQGEERRQRTEALNRLASDLEELRRVGRTYLLSFRGGLATLSTEIDPAEAEDAYALLRRELTDSGQTRLLTMLDRFWADLVEFRAHPDMDEAALLALARRP